MLRKYDKLKLISLGMLIAFFVTSLSLNVYLYNTSFLAKVQPIDYIKE
jgi:hypothetical protein